MVVRGAQWWCVVRSAYAYYYIIIATATVLGTRSSYYYGIWENILKNREIVIYGRPGNFIIINCPAENIYRMPVIRK